MTYAGNEDGIMLLRFFALIMMTALGHGTFEASDGWGENSKKTYTFLVVGEVVSEPELLDPDGSLHVMKLKPLATLAGEFDPSSVSQLDVLFTPVSPGSIVPHIPVPRKGEHVLAVVLYRSDGKHIVLGSTCPFMPRKSSMVIVSGLGDPAVVRTAQQLYSRRSAEPTTWPAD